MPDETILRVKARATIMSGKLPGEQPDRTWGGPGAGAPCAVCELPVKKDELGLEIEFARHDNPGRDKFDVHIRCFAAWQVERKEAIG